MFFVFSNGMRRYKYVVYLAINEVHAAKDVVHKALKCLSRVLHPKRHVLKLNESKRSAHRCFLDIVFCNLVFDKLHMTASHRPFWEPYVTGWTKDFLTGVCLAQKLISLLAVTSFSPERRHGLSATGIPFVFI